MAVVYRNASYYYEALQQKYPFASKKDIRRIINYGFRKIFTYLSSGVDFYLAKDGVKVLIGYTYKNPYKFCRYYKLKLIKKIRLLSRRKKYIWDGYYYFALSNEQYDQYLQQMKYKGRHKLRFRFNGIMLYRLFDECKIDKANFQHFFRVKMPFEVGYKYYRKNYKPEKIECILHKKPWKLKDLLISNYKYDILNGNFAKHI